MRDDDAGLQREQAQFLLSSLDEDLSLESGQQEQTEPRTRSTSFLDGLRGIASFWVYMAHHIPWMYGSPAKLEYGFGYHKEYLLGQLPFIRTFFSGGNPAVAIFFVLSGYVLSISSLRLLRKNERSTVYRHLASALVRRPFRLFIPVAGVSLVFAFIMQFPDAVRPHLAWPVPQGNLPLELWSWVVEFCKLMDPFRSHGVYTAWFPYDPPAYTTAIEWQGSFFVYLSLAACSTTTPLVRMLLLAATGLLLLFTYQWSLACFAGGMVLALNDLEGYDDTVMRLLSGRSKLVLYHTIFFTGWYLAGQPSNTKDAERSYASPGWYYLTQMIPSVYYYHEYWRFYNCIGAFMMVFAISRVSWMQNLLNKPLFQYLGRVSFSLYLVHVPLLWTASDRVYRLFGRICEEDMTTWWDNRFPIPDVGPTGISTRFLAVQAVSLPMTLLLAELSTRYLDEPGMRFSKWLVGKMKTTLGSYSK